REPQRDAKDELQYAGDDHRLAGDEQLLQVHLEADHEQQQDQADFGNGLDALLVLDQLEADLRTDQNASEKIGEQQRLLQAVRDERERRGDGHAQSDAGQKVHMFWHDVFSPFAGQAPRSSRPGVPQRFMSNGLLMPPERYNKKSPAGCPAGLRGCISQEEEKDTGTAEVSCLRSLATLRRGLGGV